MTGPRLAALFPAALVALLGLAAPAGAAWTAVPPAFTGNESAALSYNDRGTLTELDQDAGLPGGVYHARSRPAGGAFGADFELPFLLPLTATRPDGTEALVGMDSARDVHTALRPDAATSFAVTDEHSTSGTYPPAGVSVASSGAGLAEWVDGAGHVEVAELPSTGAAFGPATAALPGNPTQQITFLSVVHPVLDPSGAAILTWATASDGVHYQLQQSTRTSAAGSFGAATAVGPNIEVEPQVVSNRSGVAAAVWWNQASGHVEVAVRRPAGSFGSTEAIGTPNDSFDRNSLQAGVMGDGTVVVLWRDYLAGPRGTCADGGTGTTLHVDTLKPGGTWQAAATGSTEIAGSGTETGYEVPVLAVSQSIFSVATTLPEDQGTATCGAGTKRVYAWQGAPGTFDGHAWTLLPGQATSQDSLGPAIAADARGDATVTWRVGEDRHEATTGAVAGAGGGSGGGGDAGGGPVQFGPGPAGPGASPPASSSATAAVAVSKLTVVAFNVGLGRPETIEMPISCSSDATCNVMAAAALHLLWGSFGSSSSAARASGKARRKTVVLRLPPVRLQLAPHAKGKLAIEVPKATMKRLEALLSNKGAKTTLTVALKVNGVPQRRSIATTLRIKQLEPSRPPRR